MIRLLAACLVLALMVGVAAAQWPGLPMLRGRTIGAAGTSAPPAPTITALKLNGGTTGSYSSGAASGTNIGPIAVTMSDSSTFDGTLATSSGTPGSYFSIASSQLQTNGTTPTCTSSTPYNFNIIANPGAGEGGSAFTQAVTVTCNPSGTYACLVGGNTSQAPPAIAQTIGSNMTTCMFNMDPTLSYWQNTANWIDVNDSQSGISSPLWHCFGGIPCSITGGQQNVMTDTDPTYGNSAFDFVYYQAYNNMSFSNDLGTMSTNPNTNINSVPGGYLSFPKNAIYEIELRINANGGTYGTTNYLGPIGYDLYTINALSNNDSNWFVETTFGEFGTDETNCYAGSGNNWKVGYFSFTNGNPNLCTISNSGSVLQYTKQSQLETCPTSSNNNTWDCYNCWYYSISDSQAPSFATCGGEYIDSACTSYSYCGEVGDRRLLNMQWGNQGCGSQNSGNGGGSPAGCTNTAINQDEHLYVKYLRVWSCANALGTSWPTSTNIHNPPFGESDASQPYACATGNNTLYGPDSSGLEYWH